MTRVDAVAKNGEEGQEIVGIWCHGCGRSVRSMASKYGTTPCGWT